jgi:hypothetical protein
LRFTCSVQSPSRSRRTLVLPVTGTGFVVLLGALSTLVPLGIGSAVAGLLPLAPSAAVGTVVLCGTIGAGLAYLASPRPSPSPSP